MAARPSLLPEWDTTEVNSIEPDSDHKSEGWLAPGGIPEKPPFQTFNFWQNLVYKWLSYFLQILNGKQYVSEYATLADAITDIGASNITLVIDANCSVNSNLAIPNNIILKFRYNFKITVNSSYTLTIYRPHNIQAGSNQHIFAGDGSVVFTLGGWMSIGWDGAVCDGVTDDYDAFQTTLDRIKTIGGTIYIPNNTLINSPLSATITSSNRIIFDGPGIKIQSGTSFADGGANDGTAILTLTGNDPEDLTSDISTLYRGTIALADTYTAQKGDRVCIYDAGTTWGGASKNYVPSHTTFVDYMDSDNNILNIWPEIAIDIPVSDSLTGELDSTNIHVLLYNGDCDVVFSKGITFNGGIQDASGGSVGISYGDGINLSKGKYKIYSSFYGLSESVRAVGCELIFKGEIRGVAHEPGEGNGLKIDGPSIARISDSKILNCRHAISLGGGTIYDVSAEITNSVLSGVRDTIDSLSYPGNQLGALDAHGNMRMTYVSNCKIYGGVQQASGEMYIDNSYLVSQSKEPILFYVDGTSGPDKGKFHISHSKVDLQAYVPAEDLSPPTGYGTVVSTKYYSIHSVNTGGIDWEFTATNKTIFSIIDKDSWPVATDLSLNPGNHSFRLFDVTDCIFDFKDSGVRRIDFSPLMAGSNEPTMKIFRNRVIGAGILVGNEGAEGIDYYYLFVNDNEINNTDTVASAFAPSGIDLKGDTSSLVNRDIEVSRNRVRSVGTTAGITMSNCAYRSVIAEDNKIYFDADSGTLGYGLRTSRSAITTGADPNFLAKVTGNLIKSKVGLNTITTGIQINGLDASGSRPNGFYSEANNMVSEAVTPIIYTGYNLTTGDERKIATGIYDFTWDTGAQGSYIIGHIPDDATIIKSWYKVLTAPASGGAATISIGVETDDPSGILPATAYNDSIFNAGYHDGTPDGTAANFTTETTDNRAVILTIAGADLTAGKIRVWWEFVKD